MPSSPLKWDSDRSKSLIQSLAIKRKAGFVAEDHGYSEETCGDAKRRCEWSDERVLYEHDSRGTICQVEFNSIQNGAQNVQAVESQCVMGCDEAVMMDVNSQMDVDSVPDQPSLRADDTTHSTQALANDAVHYEARSPENITSANSILRCYCRPTWDAMMYPQTFHSDYY